MANRFQRKTRSKQPIFWVVIALYVVYKLAGGFHDEPKEHDSACADIVIGKTDYDEMVRGWVDYARNTYCMDYKSVHDNVMLSQFHRNTFEFPYVADDNHFWHCVYDSIYQYDKDFIIDACNSLAEIREEASLDRVEFADAIVTFVQDIDYVYVLWGDDCGNGEYPSSGCVDRVQYGLYSPVEFLGGWIGDCDTRALLLYAILKHFGYEAAIAVSTEYQHAMLLLHGPAAGDHIVHKGIKYFFWETTAKGWPLGVMPPDTWDVGKWNVVMD